MKGPNDLQCIAQRIAHRRSSPLGRIDTFAPNPTPPLMKRPLTVILTGFEENSVRVKRVTVALIESGCRLSGFAGGVQELGSEADCSRSQELS